VARKRVTSGGSEIGQKFGQQEKKCQDKTKIKEFKGVDKQKKNREKKINKKEGPMQDINMYLAAAPLVSRLARSSEHRDNKELFIHRTAHVKNSVIRL